MDADVKIWLQKTRSVNYDFDGKNVQFSSMFQPNALVLSAAPPFMKLH